MSADSPAGRFCGDGARFMANAGRSAEIPRNRRLIGAIRGNFGHRRSLADFVGSSRNRENIGRSLIHQPAGSALVGRDLWPIREGRPKFRETATYLGANKRGSNLAALVRAALRLAR